ncbi:ATP-binding protein [Patescibacteria group bacterium]|nr:ATP-binding protein [Patescibacteria group bacterium]
MEISFTAILSLVSAIFVFGLGFFVFFKDRKSKINRIFGLMSLVVSVWLFGTFEMLTAETDAAAIFWDRFIYAGVVFVPALMYHFSLVFSKIKSQKNLLIVSYILSVVFLFLSRTDYFVSGLFRYSWGVHTQARLFHHIFLAVFFFFLFLTLKNFYRFYTNKSLSGAEKTQAKYVFLAFFILITIGSTAYAPAYSIGIYPFSFGSGLVFSIILAYAIVRHRLMDIKVVLRRSTVYLASVLTVFLPAVGILYLAESYYPDLLIVVSLSVLILGVSVFPPIRGYFYRLANKYFFSSLYDSREVIAGISDKLRSTLDINEVYNVIGQTVTNAFHSKSFGVLGYAPKSNEYQVLFNQGFDIGQETRFPGNRELQEKFVNQSKSLVVEELKAVFGLRCRDTLDLLMKFKVAVLTPLNIKDETLGLLVLGPKETGDMYNDEDLSTLEVIGSQAAIAIKNAQLYEETRKFSQTLQQEVDRQTAELKKANIELRKLDQAKSDFISIASHQLRTPLSAIKGFLSMVVEGSYGAVNADVKDKLEKTYESNERLSRLVDDLLDLSHMEGGKMEFHFAKVDFGAMVASVAEELALQAAKKKLKLEFANPSQQLFVLADEEKLRQVVMNLIDNAIKYTEKGGVEISLGKTDGHVEFSVKDTGLGMTPEELANLFKKFVRGANAPRYHTEGSGVGLYVAKLLIEAHKGEVWAESEGEGRGSTFFVKMPEYKG